MACSCRLKDSVPHRDADGVFGEPEEVAPERVGYMDVSSSDDFCRYLAHSVLGDDDANRALMGSNMQRQAVPLLQPQRRTSVPASSIASRLTRAKCSLPRTPAWSTTSTALPSSSRMMKASSTSTWFEVPAFQPERLHQQQAYRAQGDEVHAGDVWPTASCDHAELALGQNLTVALHDLGRLQLRGRYHRVRARCC